MLYCVSFFETELPLQNSSQIIYYYLHSSPSARSIIVFLLFVRLLLLSFLSVVTALDGNLLPRIFRFVLLLVLGGGWRGCFVVRVVARCGEDHLVDALHEGSGDSQDIVERREEVVRKYLLRSK